MGSAESLPQPAISTSSTAATANVIRLPISAPSSGTKVPNQPPPTQ
jgi:hypothetical protein